jgi:hypothetical protein
VRAAVLFGASQALRAAIGSPIPAPDLVRFNEAVAATELGLGKERFGAARAAGQEMPVQQAVELARGADDASEAGEPGVGTGASAGTGSGPGKEEQ